MSHFSKCPDLPSSKSQGSLFKSQILEAPKPSFTIQSLWVFKNWAQTRSINITWELVRNANSQAPPQTCRFGNWEWGWVICFQQVLQEILTHILTQGVRITAVVEYCISGREPWGVQCTFIRRLEETLSSFPRKILSCFLASPLSQGQQKPGICVSCLHSHT